MDAHFSTVSTACECGLAFRCQQTEDFWRLHMKSFFLSDESLLTENLSGVFQKIFLEIDPTEQAFQISTWFDNENVCTHIHTLLKM